MSNSVAILNQKGGVGKTTLTLGLASAAWARGVRTLVVDLDAQANATWSLGVDPSLDNLGTGDALAADRAGAAADMIVPSGWGDDIWLLPAAGDLTERDADARGANGRRRLAKALKGVNDDFDLVLIDCAPSLGLNTVNGLAAASGAALVVEPSVFGLRGVGPVLDLIETVWDADNPDLDLSGVVLNRVPAVSLAAQDRIDELKKMVGSKSVWSPQIPQRVIVNQAHHERAPIHSFGARGRELAKVFDVLLRKMRQGLQDRS
ncbi:MAG: ParA family protein [Actinomycetota bacterium]